MTQVEFSLKPKKSHPRDVFRSIFSYQEELIYKFQQNISLAIMNQPDDLALSKEETAYTIRHLFVRTTCISSVSGRHKHQQPGTSNLSCMSFVTLG